jgi:hypothetical protein
MTALFFAACGHKDRPMVLAPPPPGLVSSPEWMTFLCVEAGCMTTETATVAVVGTRDLAIKRVVLSDRTRDDFTVTSNKKPPFIMKVKDKLVVSATYVPNGDPRLGDVDLVVTYTDASAVETDMNRVTAGELHIPLVRRLIGQPKMVVSPQELDFGFVGVSAQKQLPLKIENDGFGNVGLVIQALSSSAPEVTVDAPPMDAVLTGKSIVPNVTYAPTMEALTEAQVTVQPADPLMPPVVVAVLGTSIPHPSATFKPDRGLDFGQVPVTTATVETVTVLNQGGQPLFISGLSIAGGVPAGAMMTIALPHNATTATVASLARVPITVTLQASTPGPIDTQLLVSSTDPRSPLSIPVHALITEPKIDIMPMTLDYGTVPHGWRLSKPVSITNDGFGDLVVTNASLILGSSTLFTLDTVPSLPARLQHGQTLGFSIEFRAETEAMFVGTLGIDSNDPMSPHVEVPLTASGVSCNMGCPIANGTPSCTGGVCTIGTCDMGWFDTNMDASDGCECKDISAAAGPFCETSMYVGELIDEHHDRTSVTGVLPTTDDIDMYVMFGKDDGGSIFSDAYDVRINIQSADPNIKMCVYRHGTSAHLNQCFFEGETCTTSYERTGSVGTDDSCDYTIKVFRAPSTAPTCTPYTIFLSNG